MFNQKELEVKVQRSGLESIKTLKVMLSEGTACKSETYCQRAHIRFNVRMIRLAHKSPK